LKAYDAARWQAKTEEQRTANVERQAHWRAANAELHRERARQFRREHPEKVLATNRAWVEKNRERAAEGRRRVRQANLVRYRSYKAKWRALRAQAKIGRVSYVEIWERDKGICYLCGNAIPRDHLHFDHVIPLSKGGAHSMENIRPTHATCNIRKKDRIVEGGVKWM